MLAERASLAAGGAHRLHGRLGVDELEGPREAHCPRGDHQLRPDVAPGGRARRSFESVPSPDHGSSCVCVYSPCLNARARHLIRSRLH